MYSPMGLYAALQYLVLRHIPFDDNEIRKLGVTMNRLALLSNVVRASRCHALEDGKRRIAGVLGRQGPVAGPGFRLSTSEFFAVVL